MGDREYWDRQFEASANLWATWWSVANQLLSSADYLAAAHASRREDFQFDVLAIKLLRGAALENLFKAVYVAEGNRLAEGNKLSQPSEFSSHDLWMMAEKVGRFDFSHFEQEVIKSLATSLTWKGRYPVARNRHLYRSGMMQQTGWSTGEHEEAFKRIVEKIRQRLPPVNEFHTVVKSQRSFAPRSKNQWRSVIWLLVGAALGLAVGVLAF